MPRKIKPDPAEVGSEERLSILLYLSQRPFGSTVTRMARDIQLPIADILRALEGPGMRDRIDTRPNADGELVHISLAAAAGACAGPALYGRLAARHAAERRAMS